MRYLFAVFLTEFLNPSRSIYNLLLTGIKWMTLRAYFNMQRLIQSRTRIKHAPATASYCYFVIIRMNIFFHEKLTYRL